MVGNALDFTALPVGADLLAGLATAGPLAVGAPERPTDTNTPVRGTRRTP
ncbi:hypothetical protein [Streptomyces sp. P9-A2]